MGTYVPGCGNSSPKLMIIGEAPGSEESRQGQPFVGPAGNLLNEALKEAGIDRSDVYITNVCKVQPPHNRLEDLHLIGRSIDEFIPQLWDEIITLNPNCILAIGGLALEHLTGFTGIRSYRGSILKASKTLHKVVPTLHPASLLPHEGMGTLSPWKEFAWIKHDIKRANEQSLFPEIRLPSRNLQIARSSLDVYRFLDRFQSNEMVTLDVETWKTYAQCVGLAFSEDEALCIPTFWDEISLHDRSIMWKSLCEFLADTKIKIIAQNAKFDEKRCRQIGLQWHDCWMDTAMGWHTLFSEFPKKLEFIASMCTEEPYWKDEGKEYDPKKHKIDRWFLYNAKDAAVEHECAQVILKGLKDLGLYEFFFDKIMPLHRLYSDIEDVGILLDKAQNSKLLKDYNQMQANKHEQLVTTIADGDEKIYEVYKNFNVMSNGPKNQVAKLIYGFLKCPVRKDTSDETLKALANNSIKDQRRKTILLGVLEERKIRKSISTYLNANTINSISVFPGDRIHTAENINGTETGRTSTGILKPPIWIEKAGIAFQTMTKHEDINLEGGGGDLRSEFIADPGFSFIEPDLAQAEDRVVCVLAKDWNALKDYERKVFNYNSQGLKDDRHTQTAMYVCDLGFEAVTDWYRQVGKKTRHAGNYWMQKHQHMLQLGKAGIFISEWQAGKQIERFHENNPKIHGIFHAEIIEALHANSCVLYSPHGRRRQFFNKWGEDLFKEGYAFIPQATVSDQVKFAMVRISKRLGKSYKRDFFFCGESHDSFLSLIRDECIDEFASMIKEEMEVPIDFNKCSLARDYQLVIPADFKVGKRWIEGKIWTDGMEKLKI